MLIVGLTFVAVIALGETSKALEAPPPRAQASALLVAYRSGRRRRLGFRRRARRLRVRAGLGRERRLRRCRRKRGLGRRRRQRRFGSDRHGSALTDRADQKPSARATVSTERSSIGSRTRIASSAPASASVVEVLAVARRARPAARPRRAAARPRRLPPRRARTRCA